jgi:hypothetical protein
VIRGGIAAGFLINVGEFLMNGVILKKQWEDAMQALNRPPMGADIWFFFILLGFALGILAVWTYAAIRSRFGAGPKTALVAGLLVWGLAYLYPTATGMPIQIFSKSLLLIGALWGLFEVPLATVAGAWFYKE